MKGEEIRNEEGSDMTIKSILLVNINMGMLYCFFFSLLLLVMKSNNVHIKTENANIMKRSMTTYPLWSPSSELTSLLKPTAASSTSSRPSWIALWWHIRMKRLRLLLMVKPSPVVHVASTSKLLIWRVESTTRSRIHVIIAPSHHVSWSCSPSHVVVNMNVSWRWWWRRWGNIRRRWSSLQKKRENQIG